MYEISRSMYRDLCTEVTPDRRGSTIEGRQRLLRACESSVERLAHDRHYFAFPTRTLFYDVRTLFPLSQQRPRPPGDRAAHDRGRSARRQLRRARRRCSAGTPLCCHATTRKGGACQRTPLPGGLYCPSHKHLDGRFEGVDVKVAAA